MTKYKQYFQDMLEQNQELFSSFKTIHDHYGQDPKTWQEKFNDEGYKVHEKIRRYENLLCGKSESGKYGKFSTNLSEKFWAEVRIHFPHIDKIGSLS